MPTASCFKYRLFADMYIIFFDDNGSKFSALRTLHFHLGSVFAFTKTSTAFRTHCIFH